MVSAPSLSPIGAKLTPYYNSKSVNGRMELVIVSQPEEQHRARYLTEGSRGAIKDVSGMGHPVVKLTGYYSRQPIKLECYIGHDKQNGLPHLFYQASKISGKNSTQCTACKVEGTSVIVMNLLPEHGMQATIDCVGILKERNVDVEQKLLNLNHSSKMIDFNDQQPAYHHQAVAAFTSVSQPAAQMQPQFNATAMSGQANLIGQHQANNTASISGQQQQQQPPLLVGSHLQSSACLNGLGGLSKYPAPPPSQIDENSMGAMSHAYSMDDSRDDMSTRHSMISQAESSSLTPVATASTNISQHLNGSNLNLNLNGAQQQHLPLSKSLIHQQPIVPLNSRKRSVRCRLVFRVKIPETGEILQTISTPIICTQPLGTPEICKKSTTRAPLKPSNHLELFIIGKNFLKDSKVVFRNKKNDWLKMVEPDKEFLNSSHLVCKVPDYDGPELMSGELIAPDMIEVELQVRSGGKFSEPHAFLYYKSRPETVIHVPQQQSQTTATIKFETQQSQQQQQQSIPTTTAQQQVQQQILQQQQLQQQYQPEPQQQQQFDQQAIQEQQEQQLQQQIVLQQQQIQTSQILTTIDLNDETTIVYADALQQQSQPTIMHSVIQTSNRSNGAILGALGQQMAPDPTANTLEHQQQMNGHIQANATTQQIQVLEQQQMHQQQQYQQQPPPQAGKPQFEVQQRQQQAQTMQDQQQIQQHMTIQQQQQQVQTNQLLTTTTLDLNDDSTIVYADNLQNQTSLVHTVIGGQGNNNRLAMAHTIDHQAFFCS